MSCTVDGSKQSELGRVSSYPKWVVTNQAQLECFSGLESLGFEGCGLGGRIVVGWFLEYYVSDAIKYVCLIGRHVISIASGLQYPMRGSKCDYKVLLPLLARLRFKVCSIDCRGSWLNSGFRHGETEISAPAGVICCRASSKKTSFVMS